MHSYPHFKYETLRFREIEITRSHPEQLVNSTFKPIFVSVQSHDLNHLAGRIPEKKDWMPPHLGAGEGRW